jgi:hypothetical protein
MKYFYLYILLLFLFIVGVSYFNTHYNTYENFDTNKNTIVLLGDSILKNNAYTSDGKSVEDILIEKTYGKTYCYATDHSKIVDVYNQISKIPLELNSQNTLLFLSAGGNDILTHYVDQEGDVEDERALQPMFSAYKKLIESIQIRLPKAKLYLLDIYYPNNLKYKQYHTIINTWNGMIYDYANDPKNNISGVFKVSGILTQEDDFSFGIEPSSKGGQKIAESILFNY